MAESDSTEGEIEEDSPIREIDWTDKKTAQLKEFLLNHKAVMMHCDEKMERNGLCECMHRLAEWWSERQIELEALEEQLDKYKSRGAWKI